jgi:hypothetical protein
MLLFGHVVRDAGHHQGPEMSTEFIGNIRRIHVAHNRPAGGRVLVGRRAAASLRGEASPAVARLPRRPGTHRTRFGRLSNSAGQDQRQGSRGYAPPRMNHISPQSDPE